MSNILAAPQKIIAQKMAEAVGIAPSATSEQTYADVVQRAAEKLGTRLGVDPNSTAANATKALGVAALETFGDPVNALPMGSFIKLGSKAAKRSEALASAVQKLRKAQEAGEVVGKQTGVDSRSFRQLLKATKRLKGDL